MSFKALSNWDLDKMFARNKNYGGTLSKDELPRLQSKFYVVNMSNAGEEGTHWVMVYNVRPHDVYYFDSFGQFPPEEILTRMQATGKDILRNSQIIQAFNSVRCGYFCALVAQLLDKGYEFLNIMDDFSSHRRNNEHLLMKSIATLRF